MSRQASHKYDLLCNNMFIEMRAPSPEKELPDSESEYETDTDDETEEQV